MSTLWTNMGKAVLTMAELNPCPFCDGEAGMRNPWISAVDYQN